MRTPLLHRILGKQSITEVHPQPRVTHFRILCLLEFLLFFGIINTGRGTLKKKKQTKLLLNPRTESLAERKLLLPLPASFSGCLAHPKLSFTTYGYNTATAQVLLPNQEVEPLLSLMTSPSSPQ
jgi:hypothetical protein